MPAFSDPHAWRKHLRTVAANSPAGVVQPVRAARPRCANPSCRRGWLDLLKDRDRPMFEDRWACSTRCLRTLVDAAIRRESPAAPASNAERAHRIPLGLILLSRGWITQPQLQHALTMQRRAGAGLIGRWLTEECGVAEERVLNGLALQWRCAVLSLRNFRPQEMALTVPREIVERTDLVPLRISRRGSLRLAFSGSPNPAAALAVERIAGLSVESGLLSHADWKSARGAILRCEPVRCSLERLPDRETLARRIASDLAGMQPRASRLVCIHQFFWLRLWLEDASLRGPNGTIPPSREDMLDRIYTVGDKQPA
ncbi:MAG TPA: hypothetical protein VII58_11565 [Acidobacteriaceae bacterium]